MIQAELDIPQSRRSRDDPRTPDWEELYEQIGDRVFRLTYRMTGDPEAAADLTHDTFVRVHERRHQYAGSGSVGAWVLRIAANLARDRGRRRATRWSRIRLLDRGSDDGVSAGRAALAVATRRALRELAEPLRIVLLLHDVDGFTHQEIATALEIAEGTSKARLSRARGAMRDALTGEKGR